MKNRTSFYQPVVVNNIKSEDVEISMEATGERLREYRLRAGLTQEALSEIICKRCVQTASKNAISGWETGKRLPSLHHAKFLAKLYACATDDLIVTFGDSKGPQDDQAVLVNSTNSKDEHVQNAHVRLFLLTGS